MKVQSSVFWSDSWWIEKDNAWFISGDEQMLFRYNIVNNKCLYVSRIPEDKDDRWRLCSGCVKNGMDVICIPDRGHFIWIYSLLDQSWKKIEVNNPNNVRISCVQFEKIDKLLYIYSKGLKQLIIFDLIQKEIISYIDLSIDRNEILGFGVFYNYSFYVVSSKYSSVYEVNLTNYRLKIYSLQKINDELNTICCEEGKFILCGKKRKIYIWDKIVDKLDIIYEFPPNFGEYNFSFRHNRLIDCDVEEYEERVFYSSVLVNKYIWFIPFQTNMILYLNLEENKLNMFEIEDEEETEYSLNNRILNHKFLLEYVKENRYIGLLSVKNEWIIEIDTLTFTYRVLPIAVDELCEDILCNKLFSDSRKMDRVVYSYSLENSQQLKEEKKAIIGKQIYQSSVMDK